MNHTLATPADKEELDIWAVAPSPPLSAAHIAGLQKRGARYWELPQGTAHIQCARIIHSLHTSHQLSRFLENHKFFAMERSEVHKRPMGEFYNGEADDLHGGNNEGPRKYRGGLFLSHIRTITPTII